MWRSSTYNVIKLHFLMLKSGVHIHIVFSTIPNIFFDPSFYVMDNSLQLLVSDSDLLI